MPILSPQEQNCGGNHRDRCYGCFRPSGDCFCDIIPSIENRTEVLILQHMRERCHPFNTARIVHRALKNSRLLVDHTKNLASSVSLEPHAGLLYPGPGATLLAELPADRRPEQLVVLDGTWHHAKTLARDIPALHALHRYQLTPASPSRYRLRREPSSAFLSTVEATVAALRILEPATQGLDQLLQAFDHMVERQLAHPRFKKSLHRLGRPRRNVGNIPQALLGALDNIVVAYGESAAGNLGCQRDPHLPVYWVAQRLGTGERFSCMIRTDFLLPESLLSHLELTRESFSGALTPSEARSSWAAFQRPGDTVAVFNQGSARLLHQISPNSPKCLVLKSVDFHPFRRYRALDELVTGEGLNVPPAEHPGRAGRRLAQVAAFVHHLNTLGNDRSR